MGLKTWFEYIFLPAGFPNSVAPEYASYQLWDTIQQVTYFVNTVVSAQAIMKFHGVGDPTVTAADATALSMSRSFLGQLVSLAFTVPAMTRKYRAHVGGYRLLSEVLSACGHFMEILAATITGVAALLYGGPVVCSVSGAMSGASRSVIMTHFARCNNNGDVSLKESNQDRGGKIFGLGIGIGMLAWVGMGSSSAAEEQASLHRSIQLFAALSVFHIAGNVLAVRTLSIPPAEEPKPADAKKVGPPAASSSDVRSFLRALLLPPGYPESVAPTYRRYVCWQSLCDLTLYPKSMVTQLYFWRNVYGVGDASKTPVQAVYISIFMTSVDCVAGLISGFPALARQFYGDVRAWRFRSTLLGPIVGETIYLLAGMAPPGFFYILIVISVALGSLGGVSRKVVDAEIMKNWSRSPEVQLVHVTVAARNMSTFAQFSTAVLCLAYATWMSQVDAGAIPRDEILITLYMGMQCWKVFCSWQCARYVPSAADVDGAAPQNSRKLVAPILVRSLSEPVGGAEPLLGDQPARSVSAEGLSAAERLWGEAYDTLGAVPIKGQRPLTLGGGAAAALN